MTLKKINIFT